MKDLKFFFTSNMYLKNYMEDPGDDLKKVLKFQQMIKDEKKILYKEFTTIDEFGKLTRIYLSNYVIRVKNADAPYEVF